MSDINEVLERLRRMFDLRLGLAPALVRPSDVRALLDEHARLQARVAELEAAPAIDVERFRQMLDGWKNSDYPFSYEGQCAQRALDACIADAKALIDGSPKGSSTAQRIELTNGQIAQLADFAGTPDPGTPMEDQDVLVILHWNNGHSGPGLYAYYDELPEEGAIHLDGEVQQ